MDKVISIGIYRKENNLFEYLITNTVHMFIFHNLIWF